MPDVFKDRFEYNDRPCRVTKFLPKKCSCGDCERDFDLCDILFTDNLEFKSHIIFQDLKQITPQTDSNINNENIVSNPSKV